MWDYQNETRARRFFDNWRESLRWQRLAGYFQFYNTERPHEALGYRTPHEVHFGTTAMLMPDAEAVV